MIRTGDEYRDSIRDGRKVFVNGEKVADVTTHTQFKPLVDIRARIYDMQHEAATRLAVDLCQPRLWHVASDRFRAVGAAGH